MLAVQLPMQLPRALPPRARRNRRAFQPGTPSQPYRLPHEVRDRLQASLRSFRNREAAYRLAVFLGRFWSMPGRVALPFPIDRRALADREDLELTEAQVRGAIKTLEAIGFLARWITSGSKYKPTPHGLHRKPIPFTFGSEYAPLFIAANKRAAAARGRQEGARRAPTLDRPSRPPEGHFFNSPKRKSEAEPLVIMGERNPPRTVDLNANLEAALDRLREAVGKAGAKREGRG